MLGTSIGVFVQTGLVAGSVVGMPEVLGTTNSWWIIYLIELISLLVVIVIFYFHYETPGYLLFKNQEEKARISLHYFYKCKSNEVDGYISELRNNMTDSSIAVGLIKVLKDEKTRRGVIVGATTGFAMSFSGVAGKS